MLNRILENLPTFLGRTFEAAFWFLSLLALAGVLYLVVSITSSTLKNEKCPLCKQGVLQLNRFWHAQLLISDRRTCESWTDHECKNCGAHLRKHRGEWEGIAGSLPRHVVDLIQHDALEDGAIAHPKAKILALSSSGKSRS